MANLEHQRKYLQEYNESNKRFKTDKEINYLCSLYSLGLNSRELAKLFNCSKPTVLKALKQANVVMKKSHESPRHRSKNQFGNKNSNWKGGIKSVYDRIRDLKCYWNWHTNILKKYNNICQNCHTTKNLEVHHIKTLKSLVLNYCEINKKTIKDLNEVDLQNQYFYDENNGVPLCKKCHREHHKKYGR